MTATDVRRAASNALFQIAHSTDPADGAELLNRVAAFVSRFVRLPSPSHTDAVTLWAVHTHAIDAFETTPRLVLLSPEKGSGKTRAMEVLSLLVDAPMFVVNISAAALFRALKERPSTLLQDEADTVFGSKAPEHEDLRGLLNSGYRRGASIWRVVGQGTKMHAEAFPSFCPVALSGLGELPDTIMSRAIVVRMRRRSQSEYVEQFRARRVEPEGLELRQRIADWASAHHDRLAAADPAMPDGVVDRSADNWEALLAVADAAGGDWPQRARSATSAFVAAHVDDGSRGVRLLTDVRAVFDNLNVDKLPSAALAKHLAELEESPWGDLRGKAIDARELARRIRPFDVRPHTVRIGDHTPKGYERADFSDAWERYLPIPPIDRNIATSGEAATESPLCINDVADVADVAVFPEGDGMLRMRDDDPEEFN